MIIDITETHVTLTIARDDLPEVVVNRREDTAPVSTVILAEDSPLRERTPRVETFSRAFQSIHGDHFEDLVTASVATHLAYTKAEDTEKTFLRDQIAAIISENDPESAANRVAQQLMDMGIYLLPPASSPSF